MENLAQKRNAFANANGAFSYEDQQYYAGLHPDQRAVPVERDLVLASEIETRYGSGYVLPDGYWFDPLTQKFFGLQTEE